MSVPVAYFGVILIWSTTPLAIKWSGEDVGFLFGVTARICIALALGLILIMWLRNKHRLTREALPVYLASGITIYGTFIFVYWGAQYVSSGLISVLFGLTPFFTAVIAHIWLKEHNLSPSKISGMLLGALGLLAIFKDQVILDSSLNVAIAGILVAVAWQAFGTVWFKAAKTAEVSALSTTVGGISVATPLFVLTWLFFDRQVPTHIELHTLSSIVYLGVIGSIFGMVMFYYALKKIDAAKISLITLITPVIALLLGALVNDEEVSENIVLGTALILSGLLLFQWTSLRHLFTGYKQ